MLVLTRSADEEIRIGDNIVIRVLDVKGDRVRIGIAAPMEIPVHRQEVYLEIEKANKKALQVAGAGLKGVKALIDSAPTQSKAKRGPLTRNSKRSKDGSGRFSKSNTEVTHGS